MIEAARMKAAVAKYMVDARMVALKFSARKNAESDQSRALSMGLRVSRNLTSRKTAAAANTGAAKPGNTTAVVRWCARVAGGSEPSAARQSTATITECTNRNR